MLDPHYKVVLPLVSSTHPTPAFCQCRVSPCLTASMTSLLPIRFSPCLPLTCHVLTLSTFCRRHCRWGIRTSEKRWRSTWSCAERVATHLVRSRGRLVWWQANSIFLPPSALRQHLVPLVLRAAHRPQHSLSSKTPRSPWAKLPIMVSHYKETLPQHPLSPHQLSKLSQQPAVFKNVTPTHLPLKVSPWSAQEHRRGSSISAPYVSTVSRILGTWGDTLGTCTSPGERGISICFFRLFCHISCFRPSIICFTGVLPRCF